MVISCASPTRMRRGTWSHALVSSSDARRRSREESLGPVIEPNVLLAVLVRSGLGILLVGAAIAKLAVPRQAFAAEIAAFALLPRATVPAVAAGLPGLELALGAALILGLLVPYVAAAAAALLVAFTLAVAASLLRRRRHGCGCFGGRGRIGWPIVARNLVLLGLALSLAVEVFA